MSGWPQDTFPGGMPRMDPLPLISRPGLLHCQEHPEQDHTPENQARHTTPGKGNEQ